MSKRRVVVTGLGTVCPVGNDVETMWENIKNGVCGIDEITHFDTTDFKVKLAGEIKNLNVEDYINKKEAKRLDRFSQLAMIASKQAYEDARLNPEEIDALIKDLKQCVNPFSCPHGRPTFIKLSKHEIERLFKRV